MFENVRLALSSLRSNKMRALLTMLGIIIGIGSVIAIVTVGESLTGSITDSMSGLGANNLTVALTQKSTDSGFDQGSVAVRMFGPSAPAAEDLITNEMIEEYRDTFGDQVAAVELTQSMGTGTVTSGSDSATLNLLGVNGEYFTAEDVDVQYGRAPQDSDGERQVALVSDRFLKDAFGGSISPINAIGQKFQLKTNGSLYDFYPVVVHLIVEQALLGRQVQQVFQQLGGVLEFFLRHLALIGGIQMEQIQQLVARDQHIQPFDELVLLAELQQTFNFIGGVHNVVPLLPKQS